MLPLYQLEKMIETIQKYIGQNISLSPNSKILLGVSGGADSVVLLHALCNLGYTCVVAHMNFSLRDEESDGDMQFVEKLARDWKLPFFSEKVNTRAYAEAQGISIEMAARDLRYAFFEKIKQENNLQYIAVGHHKNDLAETFLINLIRGTGVRGLSGIQAKNGDIIRPLLCLSRDDIHKYIHQHHLSFRTDRSNADTTIVRNRIRHLIIPELEQINPSLIQTLEETSQRMQQMKALVEMEANRCRALFVTEESGKTIISLPALVQHPQYALILFELLYPFGFNASQIAEIIKATPQASGKQWLAPQHRVVLSGSEIRVLPHAKNIPQPVSIFPETEFVDSPIFLSFEIMNTPGMHRLHFSDKLAYFDADKLSFPLKLRQWEHGDHFVPYGMKGTKKLSDYFIDKKLPIDQKEETFVMLSGNDIIWVIGHRTSDLYKVTDETRRVLKIQLP